MENDEINWDRLEELELERQRLETLRGTKTLSERDFKRAMTAVESELRGIYEQLEEQGFTK